MNSILSFIFDDNVQLGQNKAPENRKSKGVERLYYEGIQKQKEKRERDEEIRLMNESYQEQNSYTPQISEISQIISKNYKRDQDNFYEYNKQWQENVKNKQKQKKVQEEQEQKLIELEEKKKNILHKAKTQNYQLSKEHQGPIKNWEQNVEKYQQKKINQQKNDYNFKPKINKVSDELSQLKQFKDNSMSMPVEDRLIKNKEQTQKKIQEKIDQKQIEELLHKNQQAHNSSTYEIINNDDQFRSQNLYTNQIKKQNIQKLKNQIHQEQIYINNQLIRECPFKPKTNYISSRKSKEIEGKRKPLYDINAVKQKQQQRNEDYNNQSSLTIGNKSKSPIKSKQMKEFYSRNVDIPLHKKEQVKKNYNLEQEIEHIQACTFQPYVSNTSKQIQSRIINEDSNIYQRQVIQQQQRIKEYEKQKQEKQDQSLTQCTFKPKINKNYISSKSRSPIVSNQKSFIVIKQQSSNKVHKKNKSMIQNNPKEFIGSKLNQFETIQLEQEEIGQNQNLFDSK